MIPRRTIYATAFALAAVTAPAGAQLVTYGPPITNGTLGDPHVLYCGSQPCQVRVGPAISTAPPAPVNYSAMLVQPDPVGAFQHGQAMRAQTEAIQAQARAAQAQAEYIDAQTMLLRARSAATLNRYSPAP